MTSLTDSDLLVAYPRQVQNFARDATQSNFFNVMNVFLTQWTNKMHMLRITKYNATCLNSVTSNKYFSQDYTVQQCWSCLLKVFFCRIKFFTILHTKLWEKRKLRFINIKKNTMPKFWIPINILTYGIYVTYMGKLCFAHQVKINLLYYWYTETNKIQIKLKFYPMILKYVAQIPKICLLLTLIRDILKLLVSC